VINVACPKLYRSKKGHCLPSVHPLSSLAFPLPILAVAAACMKDQLIAPGRKIHINRYREDLYNGEETCSAVRPVSTRADLAVTQERSALVCGTSLTVHKF